MRKILIVFTVFALAMVAGLLMGSTETHSTITRLGVPMYETFTAPQYNFANDVNNATITCSKWQGYIDGIVIDSTGTDTSFKLYVKDEHAATIFSKEDLTSASEPYRFAISASDTGSTEFMGVPVNGAPQIQIADANDATLTNIVVTLYGRDYRK